MRVTRAFRACIGVNIGVSSHVPKHVSLSGCGRGTTQRLAKWRSHQFADRPFFEMAEVPCRGHDRLHFHNPLGRLCNVAHKLVAGVRPAEFLGVEDVKEKLVDVACWNPVSAETDLDPSRRNVGGNDDT